MRKRHVVETPPWLCHLHIQHQEKELIEMNPITERKTTIKTIMTLHTLPKGGNLVSHTDSCNFSSLPPIKSLILQ
jgi:hypothetical protein